MAGHSQFKNIMYRKGAQDAKRSKIFSKISREITVAVKTGGSDPNTNSRLRGALLNARAENMPKDNIERAIKKASGSDDSSNFEEVRYEGYGPGGTAIIIEALTDNKKRTAPEIRSCFSRYGGSLGESNSVSYQFKHLGAIVYPNSVQNEEEMWDMVISANASDLLISEHEYTILSELSSFSECRDFCQQKLGEPISAKVIWHPETLISVNATTAQTIIKLLDALEENDDVQSVFSNVDIPEDVIAELQ